MFKEFEKISKEGATKPGSEDPFSKLLAGMMGGADGGPEDKQMQEMFKGLMGSLGGSPGDAPSEDQMSEMMKKFSSILQEGEGSGEFQSAMESVVKDIVSKDSMYEPMKRLKDAYPEWLENNWQ